MSKKITDANTNEEIEQFIQDWHYDKKSHRIAQKMCQLFFDFIDSLDEANLSSATVRKHLDNCWAIGYLESQYGYLKKFSIDRYKDGDAMHEYEYSKTFRNSDYAMKSYASTWRKLARFVASYDSSKLENNAQTKASSRGTKDASG